MPTPQEIPDLEQEARELFSEMQEKTTVDKLYRILEHSCKKLYVGEDHSPH